MKLFINIGLDNPEESNKTVTITDVHGNKHVLTSEQGAVVLEAPEAFTLEQPEEKQPEQ